MLPGRTPARRRTLRGSVLGVLAVLVALLVVSAVAAGAARLVVSGAQEELDDRLLPARTAAADLTKAYVDQETGQRGFLLTGDPVFLEPYDSGRRDADRLVGRLRDLLGDDATALRALDDVVTAAGTWQQQTAEPEITARRAGPLPADQLVASEPLGKQRFDALRARLAALEDRADALTAGQLARIGTAQTVANAVVAVAVLLALGAALAALPLLRRRLTAPMDSLVTQVTAVADGDDDRVIEPVGPQEMATVADAVDRMRRRVLDRGRALAEAQRELVLREEHDRLATDLHDVTIQRLFALGLGLSSAARRHPQAAPALAPLVTETDRIVRDVRAVVFDLAPPAAADSLRAAVLDLADEAGPSLGGTPSVEFDGPVDTLTPAEVRADVLAAVRACLAPVDGGRGTPAEVGLRVQDGTLELSVSGTRLPAAALADLRRRAERHGGRLVAEDGVVRWTAPVPLPDSGAAPALG